MEINLFLSMTQQTEAIVLTALPFKEYDRILTLFAPQGLLKLFVKSTKRSYLQNAALTSPLTCGEFHYTQGRNELHRFREGRIYHQNLHIRGRLESLTAAEQMIHALLKSQLPHKAAPQLYHLFRLFLLRLPEFEDPKKLTTLFLLKILKHEGILQLTESPRYRYGGECFSTEEAPLGAITLSVEEENLVTELATSRHLKEILLPKDFARKITTLFDQAFS